MIHARRRSRRFLALVVVLAMAAGACGGGKKGDSNATGDEPAGDPVRGGSVTYGIEAETGDGWCLQESQLAISGILVARAIYDTLTAPNKEGEYVPYLAEDVQPNDDYTEWTITVRDGVKFHDGTDLTATVVKNNLDAYRGADGDHARSPLLFFFVLDNISDVTADDAARTVTVTTKVPWVAFPAFLYSSGRLGITAQAQLDDTEACNTNLIGTGPFKLDSPSDWVEGRQFKATKNPDYWQEAPDGKPYPYLDELVFEPIIESEQRVNALESGQIDLAHFSGAPDIIGLRESKDAGDVRAYESNANAEVTFVQMNASKPPFDDVRIRRAAALAVDRDDYKQTINRGQFESATGPFAPGSIAYIEDTGFPTEQDQAEAEQLIAEYEAEKGPLPPITYQATPGALTQETALYIQQTMAEIGVDIELETVQQDALIDNAISGEYDIMGFRNYPGGDPDELYVWFKGQSPVNFSRFDDPQINELLDQGRSETDPDARAQIYQDLNKRMGEQVYSIWANFTTWMIASSPTVFGYDPETMPKLPNGDAPSEGLAAGHPLYGLWVSK